MRVLPDRSQRLPVVDPDDHTLFINLGCVLENLLVGARALGCAADADSLRLDQA